MENYRIVQTEPFVFRPFRQLLTSEQIKSLSVPACYLYAVAWNRMNKREATEITMMDTDAAKMAGCAVEKLESLQSELNRTGLLHIEQVYNPRFVPGEERTRYTFPDY